MLIGLADIIGPPGELIEIEKIRKAADHVPPVRRGDPRRPLQREINERARFVRAISNALKYGSGAFIGGKLYSREMLERGEVAMRPIAGPPITRTLSSVHLSGRPATFVGELIRDLLIRFVCDVVQSGARDAEIIDTTQT
ncbi:hypothetical protein [Salipiger mangrovisoli]|uniref:hypothetical protein n=1 Tax=Salipiger mangrovisoli TaxID=2865933 RepID=UPI00187E1BFC|nr:hypothetical protein [Salipiger mangrovisoli]